MRPRNAVWRARFGFDFLTASTFHPGAALDEAFDKVTRAFGTGSTFADWTPYVLGDTVAERMGLRTAGIPHMGGYAVGRRIIERYLEKTGLRAAQAVVRPAAEILAGTGITSS